MWKKLANSLCIRLRWLKGKSHPMWLLYCACWLTRMPERLSECAACVHIHLCAHSGGHVSLVEWCELRLKIFFSHVNGTKTKWMSSLRTLRDVAGHITLGRVTWMLLLRKFFSDANAAKMKWIRSRCAYGHVTFCTTCRDPSREPSKARDLRNVHGYVLKRFSCRLQWSTVNFSTQCTEQANTENAPILANTVKHQRRQILANKQDRHTRFACKQTRCGKEKIFFGFVHPVCTWQHNIT